MSVKALVISRVDLINLSVKTLNDTQSVQVTEWYIKHGFKDDDMIKYLTEVSGTYPMNLSPTTEGNVGFWKKRINLTYEEFINTLIVVI